MRRRRSTQNEGSLLTSVVDRVTQPLRHRIERLENRVLLAASLEWASYLGGAGGDDNAHVATDATGNVWIVGTTGSSDLPGGGFDSTFNGGRDAFVAKVNANGTLAWASYLGGSGYDVGNAVAIDGLGNAWIAGQTHSMDFPGGGFDESYNGGDDDAFVAKINADGSFAWGSYLGGSGTDYASGIAVDSSGNAWLTGRTYSVDFPGGGFDPTLNNYFDAFVAKVNANGTLAWGSYLGGSGWEYGEAIAIDGSDNAWITGETDSTNFPSGVGGFDNTYNGSSYDAFVAKVNANGTFAWGSYLGTSNLDYARGITIDTAGNAWIVGMTDSPSFPGGGYDITYNGGAYDAYVAKVNANGTFGWGTYLGGSDKDYGYGIDADATGNVYVTGETYSSDFPIGGFDSSFNGGTQDAFIAKFRGDGTLAWGSYLGGSAPDIGQGVAVDGSGNVWASGETQSSDFPGGGFDPTHNGSSDAFIAKVTNVPGVPSAPTLDPTDDSGVVGDNITNCLRPRICGTAEPQVTIRLYDGATLLGVTSTDIAGSYGFVPASDLVDGLHTIQAVAVDGTGKVSASSQPLPLTIDTQLIGSAMFVSDGGVQHLDFLMNEPLQTPPVLADLLVWNYETHSHLPTADMALTVNAGSGLIRLTFPGCAYGAVPDGSYYGSMESLVMTDIAGNHLEQTIGQLFFFLNGDPNSDYKVNTLDFNILAGNFGGSGRVFSQGDFNYDTHIDSVDFDIMLAQYGKSLQVLGPLPTALPAAQVRCSRTLFAIGGIVESSDMDELLSATL